MKVIFVILLLGIIGDCSAASNYRGNAQDDYQYLVSVLNEMFSVGANLFDQIMNSSYKMQKNVEVKMEELVKAFEYATFQNGNLIGLMMQKWSQDVFSEMLNRMYLPIPLPTFNVAQNFDLNCYFNNSINANRNLNAVLMKMWSHLREPQTKAETFLNNIMVAFRETMDARPELIHAIAKISNREMPCYKQHNQFLPQNEFLREVYKEIDLYVELLNILDLRNEEFYNAVELEYLKMVARKFVLSASKLVSVLLELFRHSKEFEADLSGRFNNDFEIREQLILKYPEELYLLSNLFNDAMIKNKAIINLSLKSMINNWQDQSNSKTAVNSQSPNGWIFDRDFDAAILGNQQWNSMLIYHWKRLRNGQEIPSEIFNTAVMKTESKSSGAVQEIRGIIKVLNQAIDVKVKLIIILMQIWIKGREKPATPIETSLESQYLNTVISPPAIFDNTLKSQSLQNSPGFLNSLGSADLTNILGGFLLDSEGLLGLDLGIGGLGGDSGSGLSSILGSGLIDQELQSTLTKSMKLSQNDNHIINEIMKPSFKTTRRPLSVQRNTTVKPFLNKFKVSTKNPTAKLTQSNDLSYNKDAIVFPDSILLNQQGNRQQTTSFNNERKRPQSSMKFVSNGNVLMNYINNHTFVNSQLNDRSTQSTKAPVINKDAIVFPDHPNLQKPVSRQSRFIGQKEVGGETGSHFDFFGRPYFLSHFVNDRGYRFRINYG